MKAVKHFFDTLAASYAVQDYKAVAAHFDAPGALYLEDDLIVWSNCGELRKFFALHCRSNYALGVRRAKVSLRAVERASNAHFSVWVTWHHLDREGQELFTMRTRYFCRNTPCGAMAIQLVEVPRRPCVYSEAVVAPPLRRPPQPVVTRLVTMH